MHHFVVVMKLHLHKYYSYFFYQKDFLYLLFYPPKPHMYLYYSSYIYITHRRAIPTLKEKPPYFSPTLTDPQWLPDIQYEDVDRAFLTAEFGNNNNNANNGSNGNDGGSVGTGQVTTGSAGKRVLIYCILFVYGFLVLCGELEVRRMSLCIYRPNFFAWVNFIWHIICIMLSGGFARTVSFGSLAGTAEASSGKNFNSSSNYNNNDTDTVVTEQSEAVGMLNVVGASSASQSQHKVRFCCDYTHSSSQL